MADNIHEAVFLIDLDSRSLVYVSPAYEEIWGRSRDTLYARPGSWLESVAASDRPRVLEEFGKARGTGKFGFECFVDRPDGSEREIRACGYPVRDASGRIHRIAGIVQDISAKRQAERALRESERRYVDMLENIALMAVMLDCGGNVTFCNDSLLRLTGGRREEIVGGNWFQMFHTTDAESSLAVFSALLRDEPMAYHHESTVHTRSGVRRLISWNNTLLRSASGEIIGTASIGEDITEYRDSVNEIRRLNESLEERVAERTAQLEIANKELQAFAHSVSHDLRAPLNRIRGFSKILADANPAERDAREADLLGRIDNAGREMEQLIGDLMELSRVATGELQRTDVDVSAVASAMLGRFQGECPERAVDVRVEAGMRARADPGLAAVVLENLLGNAWKFTAKRHPGRIEVGIEKGGPGATSFFVRDNGAGFDVAQAARLFQPFERLHAKSEFEGTGIGLATVQRIVSRHGGRVWAEGAVDRGATFHFTLAP
jgi:PAS domain S-box-containing protein